MLHPDPQHRPHEGVCVFVCVWCVVDDRITRSLIHSFIHSFGTSSSSSPQEIFPKTERLNAAVSDPRIMGT